MKRLISNNASRHGRLVRQCVTRIHETGTLVSRGAHWRTSRQWHGSPQDRRGSVTLLLLISLAVLVGLLAINMDGGLSTVV